MMIRVRVADAESGRVALWERHPDHPAGEIFLAGPGEFEVAPTQAVEARLRSGDLVLVEPAPSPAKGKQTADKTVVEPEPESAPVAAANKRPRRRGAR